MHLGVIYVKHRAYHLVTDTGLVINLVVEAYYFFILLFLLFFFIVDTGWLS